jgi:soluble lytic murein transglycosylase
MTCLHRPVNTPGFSPFRPLRRLAAALLLLSAASASQASTGDDSFVAMRDAFRVGDSARVERLATNLAGHDLEAYADYFRLRLKLEEADSATVRAFLDRQNGTYIAEKLRGDWLRLLARKQRWNEFDSEYPKVAQPDQDLACFALQSRWQRRDKSALDEAQPLWLSLAEPPDSCLPMFEALILERRIGADDVWARMRRQVAIDRPGAARLSARYLPDSQMPDAHNLDQALDKSLTWLVKLPAGNLNRTQRELAVLALVRQARSDPAIARERFDKLADRLPPADRNYLSAVLGWQSALRHMPEALDLYRAAGEVPLSDEQHAWKVRAALRNTDWAAVRAAIEKMSPTQAAEPVWTYWLGRAWKAGGRSDEANALFARIAGQTNFYGNLADDELGRAIVAPARLRPMTGEELGKAATNVSLRRALALYRLNLRTEAGKEWNWGLRGMDDRELLAAAELARRNDIYDRAINTADKTRLEHDYSLRYLAPFGDQVRPAARQQHLDDAWVYGLMRQESRFITSAKSVVGASGLMQVMPATARWVAKKIGLKDYHPGRVTDTDTNLILGTSYLRLVLESLDNHPVLASAAYNAGPGRARKWRGAQALEGAIYAETIPFNETRDYVKKVMSNAVYYSALFDGKPQSLKTRLGIVGPRGSGEVKGEDLP